MGRRERDPVKGTFRGVLDTGKGSRSGKIQPGEIEELAERTQPLPRFVPGLKALRDPDPVRHRRGLS